MKHHLGMAHTPSVALPLTRGKPPSHAKSDSASAEEQRGGEGLAASSWRRRRRAHGRQFCY
jgi:hypothetical protein